MPSRVVLQDFTGVPAVVDLAAMRDAMAALGGDPARVNPLVPADLVIDHSVQIDAWGGAGAFAFNMGREYERNGERYQLLRWAQTGLPGPACGAAGHGDHPPGQPGVPGYRRHGSRGRRRPVAFPDTLVGTGLPYDDDQRARRPRLRRGRDRGRGRPPGPAALPADAADRGRPPDGRAAEGHDRHGPGPHHHRDAALVRRRRGVRGVRRRRACRAGPGRPRDDLQHEPRVRATATLFPIDDETLATCGSPAGRLAGSSWWSGTRRPRACGARRATGPSSMRRWSSTSGP